MKTEKNINPAEKQLIPLNQSEKGKLKGGFSAFTTLQEMDKSTNVNVDVASDHTCACACS